MAQVQEGCEGCPGMCCKGLEESVTRPRTKDEIESVAWQLQFENTQFFIRNRRWYQLTLGSCMYLDEQNFCTIYDRRPDICRDHNPPACEFHGSIYDTLFETREDFEIWIANEKAKKKKKRLR